MRFHHLGEARLRRDVRRGHRSRRFFDRLVETCPMRLTSNNAPEVRDLIATVMVSMVNIRLSRSDQVG